MSITPIGAIKARVQVVNHPDYEAAYPKWVKMDDCYNRRVKEFAQRYLAIPAGNFQSNLMKSDALEYLKLSIDGLIEPIASESGWTPLGIKYAHDGNVPDLVGNTTRGNMSLVGEHDPVVELPQTIEYIKDSATKDNKDLTELYLRTTLNTMLKGRTPILIDVVDGKLKFVKYNPKALLNWESKSPGTDDGGFKWMILRDYEDNPAYDPIDNRNVSKYVEVIMRHKVDDGVYMVDKYKIIDGKEVKTTTIPKFFGKSIDFIPAVAIGSLDNTPDIDVIPMEAIADSEIGIYDLSCMLKHAENASAVPTMYITGADKEEAPAVTGAGVLITLADSQARVGYTKTDTSAMAHISGRIDGLYQQAQELGASLLGARKGAAESGEALRLRQASATATLKSVVVNVGNGITALLKMAAIWSNVSTDEVVFTPNDEFSTFALTANETIALVQSWQAGSISHSTLLENFLKAGMLQAGETVEDEKSRLAEPGEKYVAPVEPGTTQLDVGGDLQKPNTLDKKVM